MATRSCGTPRSPAASTRRCAWAESHRHGLVRDIEVDAHGLVHAPSGAGLGVEIDFELIRRHTLAVLS